MSRDGFGKNPIGLSNHNISVQGCTESTPVEAWFEGREIWSSSRRTQMLIAFDTV
jgi:hypothetical protein